MQNSRASQITFGRISNFGDILVLLMKFSSLSLPLLSFGIESTKQIRGLRNLIHSIRRWFFDAINPKAITIPFSSIVLRLLNRFQSLKFPSIGEDDLFLKCAKYLQIEFFWIHDDTMFDEAVIKPHLTVAYQDVRNVANVEYK